MTYGATILSLEFHLSDLIQHTVSDDNMEWKQSLQFDWLLPSVTRTRAVWHVSACPCACMILDLLIAVHKCEITCGENKHRKKIVRAGGRSTDSSSQELSVAAAGFLFPLLTSWLLLRASSLTLEI